MTVPTRTHTAHPCPTELSPRVATNAQIHYTHTITDLVGREGSPLSHGTRIPQSTRTPPPTAEWPPARLVSSTRQCDGSRRSRIQPHVCGHTCAATSHERARRVSPPQRQRHHTHSLVGRRVSNRQSRGRRPRTAAAVNAKRDARRQAGNAPTAWRPGSRHPTLRATPPRAKR